MKSLGEIRAKLLAEGDADQIALFFQSKGIKGRRNQSSRCPVANYVRQETGCHDVAVSSGDIATRRTIRMAEVVSMNSLDFNSLGPVIPSLDYKTAYMTDALSHGGTAIHEFVRNFDAGKYPELEA